MGLMKFNHRTLIRFAGLSWLAIGIFLLSLGIHFILETLRYPSFAHIPGRFSLLTFTTQFVPDTQNALIILLTFALLIGYIKGRYVLNKTVDRQVKRIAQFPNPMHIKYLYTRGYYILIASMIGLGVILRFLPISIDTRGVIDAIIGAALMNGAMLYFRAASNYTLTKKKGL